MSTDDGRMNSLIDLILFVHLYHIATGIMFPHSKVSSLNTDILTRFISVSKLPVDVGVTNYGMSGVNNGWMGSYSLICHNNQILNFSIILVKIKLCLYSVCRSLLAKL